MQNFVAYYRLSTKAQLQGYGLNRQVYNVREYVNKHGSMLYEYAEIRSGRKKPGPELIKAMMKCETENAVLIVEDVDRFPRRVDYVAWLIGSCIDYVIVDCPGISNIEMQVKAISAEEEVRKNSRRSKQGLELAKMRGKKLGTHNEKLKHVPKINKKAANEYARKIAPIVSRLRASGHTTIMQVCEGLNRLRIPTPSGGGVWHISTTHNYLKRIEMLGLSN